MSKRMIKVDREDLNVHAAAIESAKKILGEACACCILISCTEPKKDGNMDIEMHYEGDEILAAFLLESANQVFEERFFQRASK